MKKPESIKNLKSITVNSSKEAWSKVEITVDLYDATKRACYTIYRSFNRESGCIDYEGGHISCLGTSIELNFEDGYEAAAADKTAKRIAELEAENEALRKRIADLEDEAERAEAWSIAQQMTIANHSRCGW